MKRVLVSLLILVASAFPQAAPLKLVIDSGKLTVQNISAQEVIAFVVNWSNAKQADTPLSHDWYCKSHGIMPVEVRELNGDLPDWVGDITKATLLFVQFVDGSTWGDVASSKDIMDRRAPMKQFYQALSTAAGQGEGVFLDRLNNEKVFKGDAKHLLQVQQQSGTQTAVDMVNERLAAANSHNF